MEVMSPLLTRLICAGLVMGLLTPPGAMAWTEKQDEKPGASQQAQAAQPGSPTPEAGATSTTVESQPAPPNSGQLPDSPESVQSQATTQSMTSDQAQASPAAAQSNNPQPPQGKAQQPAGTAAAQVENTTGDAAYKPAGAAIAPAKQGRKRMILIKVGVLIGAGVAIGSVAALSSASPSRPPGSH